MVTPRQFVDPHQGLSRQLYGLAWPAFAENVLQTTLGIVALALVGQLGATTIASVGLGNQVFGTAQTVLAGWAVGTTALVARQIGAGRGGDAGTITRQSMIALAVISLSITALITVFAHPIMLALGAPGDVAAGGESYLRILALSLPGAGLMLVGGGALRGSGDSRTPMWVSGVTNVVNIVLAYMLVLGMFGAPAMGARGAAWAAVIGRTIGAIIIVLVVIRRMPTANAKRWLDMAVMRRVGSIGGPAAAEQLTVQVGFLAFNLIAIRVGTAEFAAMQIAFNVAQVSQVAGLAFATAATTMVGQSLGANRPDRARRAGWQSTWTAVVWMTLMGIVFIIFGDPIFRAYGADDRVTELGRFALIVMGIGQAPQAISFVLSGALRGAGDTRATLVGGLIGTVGIRAGVSFVMSVVFGLGFLGIWTAWIADWIARSLIFTLRFRSKHWERIRV